MDAVTNRYAVVGGIDRVWLEDGPLPEVGPSQVRVRSVLVGICGSDLHAAHGEHPFMALPYQPGHEAVGVVDAVDEQVTGVSPGDRVLVEPNLACGHCRTCRAGRYNICEHLAVFGCQTPGAMADFFVVPADRLHPVPEEMSDEAAALVEPLATPVHAVRLAAGVDAGSGTSGLTGRSVVVLGAGTIGLLTLVAARESGARSVVVTDLRTDRLARATRLGADAAVAADSPDAVAEIQQQLGGPADVVFDCVAGQSSMAQAVSLVGKGGTVMVVGVPTGPVTVPLHLVQDRELTIRGALMYVAEDVRAAVRILNSGRVRVADLITDVFPLEQVQAAFARADSQAGAKVLVRVSQPTP